MSKVVKGIVYTVSILTLVWFIASWADVVADNTEPNPQHSEYNMFVLMTQDKQEEEYIGTCGNPLEGTSDIRFGCVYEITDNSIIFQTDEGDLYETYVGNPQEFSADRYYCLFFQGDEIFKAWEERW